MPYFTYDTSIIISRKLTDLQRMPQNFLMSAVVLMELMAGAEDRSIQKFWAGTFRHYQRQNLLIVPTVEDWLLAARILYLLTHSRKLLQQGKLRRLPARSFSAPGTRRANRSQCATVERTGYYGELGGLQGDSALLQHHHRQSG